MADGGKKGGRKVSKDSTSDRYGDKDQKDPMEAKAKVKKVRTKPEIARIAESKGASERIVHANGPTVSMTKMAKVHPGKGDLRERSQKNLQAWRHLMVRENGVGPDGTGITRW